MAGQKISVIIPVYKAEAFLGRCLDSVLGQSHSELELILVDDGSPDGSGAICDEYARKDARVKAVHTENRGAFAARNTALDLVTGDYISFVDADDWLDREMYAKLLMLMESTEADAAQCEMINEGSYAQHRSRTAGETLVFSKNQLTEAMFQEWITHGLLNKLFKAELWKDLRFPAECYHEDAMTIARIGDWCGSFARMDEGLYHYNTTNESITRGRKKPLHIKSMERLFAIFSDAAKGAGEEASFFICSEIPSTGRLILPGGEIGWGAAHRHLRAMHGIFMAHWRQARCAAGYRSAGRAKKLLWHVYAICPELATALVYARAAMAGKRFQRKGEANGA